MISEKKRNNLEFCYLCGKDFLQNNNKEIDRDHFPSKNLFPKPRPKTLFTLRTHRECNKSYDNKEKIFKNSLCYKDHKKLKTMLRSNLFSPSPIYLPNGYVILPYNTFSDKTQEAISDVLRKFVQGLYTNETGYFLEKKKISINFQFIDCLNAVDERQKDFWDLLRILIACNKGLDKEIKNVKELVFFLNHYAAHNQHQPTFLYDCFEIENGVGPQGQLDPEFSHSSFEQKKWKGSYPFSVFCFLMVLSEKMIVVGLGFP